MTLRTKDCTEGITLSRVVRVPLGFLIETNVEGLNDFLTDAITAGLQLEDIAWNVEGHDGDDILLRVRGYLDMTRWAEDNADEDDVRDLKHIAHLLATPEPLSPNPERFPSWVPNG